MSTELEDGLVRCVVWGNDRYSNDPAALVPALSRCLSERAGGRRAFGPRNAAPSAHSVVRPENVDDLVYQLAQPAFMTIVLGHGSADDDGAQWHLCRSSVGDYDATSDIRLSDLLPKVGTIPVRLLMVDACFADRAAEYWAAALPSDAVLLVSSGKVRVYDSGRWLANLFAVLAGFAGTAPLSADQLVAAYEIVQDSLELQEQNPKAAAALRDRFRIFRAADFQES